MLSEEHSLYNDCLNWFAGLQLSLYLCFPTFKLDADLIRDDDCPP